MPTFKIYGNLVLFAVCKNHYGFYATPSINEVFSNELAKYKGGKGTVQFPKTEPLPYESIKQIVKFRVIENTKKTEEKLNKKNKKKEI